MEEMKVVAGLDIGNGYVKGTTQIYGVEQIANIDIPSCTGYVVNPIDIPMTDDQIPALMKDLFNHMDLDFDTPLIHDTGRRLFGKRGIESGKSIEDFAIDSNRSKSEQDLSAVLVLGCIAGSALRQYYEDHQELPTEILKVKTVVSLALPINEYKKNRDLFSHKFCDCTHLVSFHNFERPVRLELEFLKVPVLAEGASAQLAIIEKGEPLMNLMLADVRSHGIALDGITAQDVIQAENTVGIDIGAGTVNNAVYTNGKFNTDASMTLAKGFDTILTNACEPLALAQIPFNNRKALADFLQQKPNALTRQKRESVVRIVEGESLNLVRDIVSTFTRVMERSNGLIQVAYVYGGGATPLKHLLYDSLIEAAKPFCGGGDFPILYLDSQYSRYLNKQGLFSVAKQFADQYFAE